MQSYDEIVNSGTDWLGYIPAQWSIKRGKFLYQNKKVVNKGMAETQRLALTLRGVIERKDGDNLGLNPESLESYQIFEKNDLVFKLIDLENKQTSRVGLTPKRGIMSPAYIRLTPKLALSPGYFFYYYYSLYLTYVFNNIAGEGVRANLSAKELLELPAPVPSLQTQQKIADFLDTETAQIDNLIAKQERLLELLEEKRRATITNAVTRGLDPGVELKETNIPWLSEIPQHWHVVAARRLFAQRKERAFPGQEQLTASQKYGVITQRNYMNREKVRIVIVEKDHEILKQVEPGDFVISMRSFQGGLEYSRLRGSISSAYVMLFRLKDIDDEYFKYLFKCDGYIQMLQSTSNLIRDGQAMRYANFIQVPLPLPPKDEQKDIAVYLDKENAKCNQLKQKIQTQITLLRERRTSLISHAVTGKVKIT